MEQSLRDISEMFTTLFAVSVMLSMGLNLRLQQVLRPLTDVRLVAGALLASFVIVPLAALLLADLFNLNADLRVGLILISAGAGAPLVPKLAQMARGNVPASVGLVSLLVVATLGYMPLALPAMLPDVRVDSVGIASALLLQMLLPLILGLALRASFEDFAALAQPQVALLSNISLVVMLALILGLNIEDVVGLAGKGAISSILLMIAAALVSGYVLGGPGERRRRVVALATGQRNLAAAFVVAAGSFADREETMAMLAAAGTISMVAIIPLAIALGRIPLGDTKAPMEPVPEPPPAPSQRRILRIPGRVEIRTRERGRGGRT